MEYISGQLELVEDVLIAVEACPLVDEIMVITNDPAAIELAEGYGALILPEPAEACLSIRKKPL